MNEKKHSLLGGIQRRIGEFSGDLGEMLSLRAEMARLELEADLLSARRLAIVLSACGVMALTALPLGMTALAICLQGKCGIALHGWLAIFGAGLLLIAATAGFLSWRHFRHNLVGLKQTREELQEDLQWLRELRGKPADEPK